MTQRSRSHQIETESRNALRAALPSAWTVERIVNDYGIDERVEIFDAKGRATGLVFYVQLKATDIGDETRALKIRVREKHLSYWNRLADPVLLVLWHIPTKSLYWRWAHHHHPYGKFSAARPDGLIPPTLTVKFSSRGLWNVADPERLASEVRYLRKVQSWSLHLPLTVGVTSHDRHPLTATSVGSLVAEMRAEIEGNLIRWQVGVEEPGCPHVYVGDHYFELRLGRLVLSIIFDPKKVASLAEFRDSFSVEIPATLGLALCETGSTSAGFELLSRYGPRSQRLHHWGDPRLRALLLEAIVRTGRYELALSLIDAWRSFDTPEHIDAANRLARELYGFYWRLPEPILSSLESSLDRHEPGGTWRDEPRRIALFLLAEGAFEDSLAAFQSLLRVRDNDDIVLAGAAKAAFYAGQFASAADAYQKLLARRSDAGEIRLNLARCYVMMGQYRDALALYEAANDPKHSGEIQTARLALALVIGMVGEKQERQPTAAEEISREVRDADSDAQVFERFAKSLLADAVSPNTWRQYVLLVLRRSPTANLRSLAFNVIAFFSMDDLEWFTLAAVEALREFSMPAFALAIEYGLESFRERFILAFADLLTQSGMDAAKYRAVVEAIWKLKQEGLALRMEVREGNAEGDNLPIYWIEGSKSVPEPNKTSPRHSD